MTPQTALHIGDTVTVTGTGFDLSSIANNQVYFINSWYVSPNVFQYDSVIANTVSVTDTTIKVIVPEGAINGNIAVRVNVSITAGTPDHYIYFSVSPTITGFIPNSGFVGDTITITGTGFDSWHSWNNHVWFTNGNNTYAISATPVSIKSIVTTGSTTGPIKVFTNGPGATSTFDFTVLPSIQPPFFTSGEVGTQVTINGNGLDPSQIGNYEIRFNGVLAKIDAMTSYSIGTSVPIRGSSGPVTVTFNGNAIRGSGFSFTVIPSMPTIASYSVYSGFVGTPVTIIGSGFDQAGPPLTVTFGGVAAKVASYTQESINTSVPLGAASGPISVTSGGVTGSGSNLSFRVLEKVSGVNLRHARVGDTVIISGNGFQKGPSYYNLIFPGLGVYANVSAITDTTMKYVVPLAATSAQPILKSNFNLNVSVTLPYLGIIPTVSSLDPDTAFIGRPQQWLYINGTGFGLPSTQATVIFPNNFQTNYNVLNVSPTQIKVPLPTNLKTGPISVLIDSLIGTSKFDLIVLPDTFPYKPLPPMITSPNPITSTSFTCRWLKTYRAVSYLLDASSDNFSTFLPGFHNKPINDTLQAFTGLSEGTRYVIRLRAISTTDTSDYGGAAIFTIPPAPIALAPHRIDQLDFILQWRATKSATGYNLEVSNDSFVHKLTTTVYDTIQALVITDVSKAPSFEYRLRAFNDSGVSEYSNVIVVTVITEVVPSPSYEVVVFPNPSTDYIQILGLHGPIVESILVDETGKTLRADLRNENGDLPTLDVRTLAKGLYVLRIGTNSSVMSVKFIKQ